MPWLPLYLLDSDINLFNDFLNKDEEVFFIDQVDRFKWKLVKELDIKKEGYYNKYRLWHLPSGPIPLINEGDLMNGKALPDRNALKDVLNPFEPWIGHPCGDLPGLPFFGDDEIKVFTLTINNPITENFEIPISAVEWLGNRYRQIGYGAELVTEKWWKKLRSFTKKNGVLIPRCNNPEMRKEIYAFPEAWKEIKGGRACSLR